MKPELSVIIASYNSGKLINDCLKSLENQKTDKDFEIIVVDSSTDDTAELIKGKFHKVNLFKFTERKYCGDARNFGISVAKGKIIAFIDADCIAHSNWINEILKAHQSSHLAIGGAIANGNPESYVGWAAYLCEFSQWMPDSHTKYLIDIAGANMSYKRKVFEQFGNFIEGTYCSDTDFHWRLKQNGHSLLFVPSILIFHHNIDTLRKFLLHEYIHGQSFARVRIKSQNISLMKRFLYAIFFPAITWKLFFKVGFITFKSQKYFYRYLKVLPLLLFGLISWSFGECIGYTTSKNNSVTLTQMKMRQD